MVAPFEIERRDSRTWKMYLFQSFIKPIDFMVLSRLAQRFAPSMSLMPQTVGSPELQPPKGKTLRGCSVKHRVIADFHVYDILPAPAKAVKDASSPNIKLVYFAGGGFQTVATSGHWEFVAELTNRLPNCKSILVSYPMSPINTAPKAYASIQKAYLAILVEATSAGETVVVAGDSAGGNLSLGLTLSTLKEDSKAPYASTILAITPAVETSHNNPEVLVVEKIDPVLTKAYCLDASAKWCAEWPTTDPRLSPLFADFSVLVERDIHVVGVIAGCDILAPDTKLLVDKTKEAGVRSDWLIWERQMHCFPVTLKFGFAEAIEGTDWIIEKLTAKKAAA